MFREYSSVRIWGKGGGSWDGPGINQRKRDSEWKSPDSSRLWDLQTNFRHHGDAANRRRHSAGWPAACSCPWLPATQVSQHKNAAFAIAVLSVLGKLDLAQAPTFHRYVRQLTKLSWQIFTSWSHNPPNKTEALVKYQQKPETPQKSDMGWLDGCQCKVQQPASVMAPWHKTCQIHDGGFRRKCRDETGLTKVRIENMGWITRNKIDQQRPRTVQPLKSYISQRTGTEFHFGRFNIQCFYLLNTYWVRLGGKKWVNWHYISYLWPVFSYI